MPMPAASVGSPPRPQYRPKIITQPACLASDMRPNPREIVAAGPIASPRPCRYDAIEAEILGKWI
jgi:hypothetical protein